jgi:hypothetical protein
VNKGDTESSFASDAEGSGEIATILGETLGSVAQAIDHLDLDLDRTPAAPSAGAASMWDFVNRGGAANAAAELLLLLLPTMVVVLPTP